MAIHVNIEKLLSGKIVESERIEYKKGWNPASIYRTICAFANDFENIGGGYIIVGAEEENGLAKRPVSGISIDELNVIQRKMIEYNKPINPYYAPKVSIETVDNDTIFVFALMMFNHRPEKFFPYSRVEIVEFPKGMGDPTFFEKPAITGPVNVQIKQALLQLQSVVLKERIYKNIDRPESDRIWNYPYRALEESIANALYHRTLEVREPVEIRILPDCIEIISYFITTLPIHPAFWGDVNDNDETNGNLNDPIFCKNDPINEANGTIKDSLNSKNDSLSNNKDSINDSVNDENETLNETLN